jgi:hypothetical protein
LFEDAVGHGMSPSVEDRTEWDSSTLLGSAPLRGPAQSFRQRTRDLRPGLTAQSLLRGLGIRWSRQPALRVVR